jgi:translation initiation factor IF-2
MEQEAAAQAARREYEMKQLGMTELQQRQAAEMQQKQLDRQVAESQANEAYRMAALAQAPQLAAQQQAATAEQARLAREANAAEALLSRQFQFGLEQQRQKAEGEREARRITAETARDAARIKAEQEARALQARQLPASVIGEITKPIPTGQVDARGDLVTDLEGRPLTRPPTQEEMQQRAQFFSALFGARSPQFSAPTAGGATRGAGGGGLAALMKVLEKQSEDRRKIEARRGAK